MATRDERKGNHVPAGNRGRLQIFVAGFAVEGNDSVLADGFKAIRDLTEAMKHSGVLAPPAAKVRAVLANTSDTLKTATQATEVSEAEDQDEHLEPETDEESIGDQEQTLTNGNGTGPKRSYNFKTPTFLNDLDVSKATKDLNAFIAEKNPADVMSKYLVVVYWLQKYLDIPEVKIDHVYTIFDILNWKTEMPGNPSAPLRDLKSKKHMLTREKGAEGYKLNFKGEQEVGKMK